MLVLVTKLGLARYAHAAEESDEHSLRFPGVAQCTPVYLRQLGVKINASYSCIRREGGCHWLSKQCHTVTRA